MKNSIFRIFNSFIALLILLCPNIGCSTTNSLHFQNFFQRGRITFKPGKQNNSFNLSQLSPGTAVVLLPVRSTMGGGLGEEQVTRHFDQSLKARFSNLKIITNADASQMFTQLNMWEDYFEYLAEYQENSVKDFKRLRNLYQQLGIQYIISITSDYQGGFGFPSSLMLFLHVELWDLATGQKLWEGTGEGEDVVDEKIWLEEVIEETAKKVSRLVVQKMGTDTKSSK